MTKKATVKITADSKEAQSGLNKATSALNKFKKTAQSHKMANFITSVNGTVKALKLLIDAVKKANEAIKESILLTNNQIKSEIQLETAAKNNPYLTNESVNRLKEYASSLQKISAIGDEELLPQMAKLATAGRTQAEIQKIMSAAVDMSASGVMNLESAVTALNGTFTGSTGTLGRQIVEIKQLTKEELANGAAVDIIAEKYKGMAENVTLVTKSREAMEAAKGDFKESIGTIFKPTADLWNSIWQSFYEKGIKVINSLRKEKIKIVVTTDDGKKESKKVGQAKEELLEEVLNIKSNEPEDFKKIIEPKQKEYYQLAEETSEYYKEWAKNQGYTQEQIEKGFVEEVQAAYEGFCKDMDEIAIVAQHILSDSNRFSDEAINALTESFEGLKYSDLGTYELSIMNAVYAEQKKREEEAKKTKEKLLKDQENAEKTKNAAEAKKSYTNTLSDYDKQIERRKKMGETISEEEEILGRINTMQSGILKLVEEENGVNWDNWQVQNEFIPQLQEQYELYNKIVSKKQKLEGIKETDKLIEDIAGFTGQVESGTESGGYQKKIDAEIAKLQELKENHKDNAESVKTYEEKIKELSELKDPLKVAELKERTEDLKQKIEDFLNMDVKSALSDSILETINTLEIERSQLEENSEAWERYSGKIAELSGLREKVLKKEHEETTKEQLENIAKITSYTAEAAGHFTDIITGISEIATQQADSQAQEELTKLSKSYTDGIISYEEYCDKKGELNKKAAREQYKIDLWNYYSSILTATANIAQGVTAALSQTPPMSYINAALTAASGAVQIATLTANKPKAPNFATGGIVQGSSWSGDKVRANVNSGEMILTAQQQRNLWEAANRRGGGNAVLNMPVTIENNTSARIRTNYSLKGLRVIVDDFVNSSMNDGRYDDSISAIQTRNQGQILL